MKRLVFTAIGAGFLGASLLGARASAQMLPAYSSAVETIHGTISGFTGKYELRVHDVRGYMDRVVMHDGTIINPTGLSLSEGMAVTILGRTHGTVFDASEIDTPYHYESRAFVPVYPAPIYPGPYFGYPGYVGVPYGYSYGPYPYGYPGYYGGPTIIIGPRSVAPRSLAPSTATPRPVLREDPSDRFRSFRAGESRRR